MEGLEDLDLGPIAVLVCWQSVVLAVAVASLTHVFKRAIDYRFGSPEIRRKHIWVQRLLLPSIPLMLGVLVSVSVPLHPDALMTYMASHEFVGLRKWAILAIYGLVVGQFSDYVWSRYTGLKSVAKKKLKKKPEDAEQSEDDTPTPPMDFEVPPAFDVPPKNEPNIPKN